MNEKKWNDIDRSSRQLFILYLKAIKATDIEESHGNCSYDIKAKVKGKVILWEIKDRSFAHDRFGDVCAEGIKRDCNNRRIAKGEADACCIANVFTDNVICLANVNDKRAKVQKKWCNYTTLIDDQSHDKVEKTVLSLPQTIKIKFMQCGNQLVFKKIT